MFSILHINKHILSDYIYIYMPYILYVYYSIL